MSRLPVSGSDSNNWGIILNDFLSVSLNTDGTLRSPIQSTGSPSNAAFRATGTASTDQAYVSYIGAEANPHFRITSDGAHNWGGGGGSVTDTNLYRSAGGILKTDGQFYAVSTSAGGVGTTNEVGIGWSGLPGAGIYFGNAADTNLYRVAAGTLKSDGRIMATGAATGGTPFEAAWGNGNSGFIVDHLATGYSRIILATSGGVEFLRIGGGGNGQILWSGDTNLYRSGTANLQTDSYFFVNKDPGSSSLTGLFLYANYAGAFRQVQVGAADSGGVGFRMLRLAN